MFLSIDLIQENKFVEQMNPIACLEFRQEIGDSGWPPPLPDSFKTIRDGVDALQQRHRFVEVNFAAKALHGNSSILARQDQRNGKRESTPSISSRTARETRH